MASTAGHLSRRGDGQHSRAIPYICGGPQIYMEIYTYIHMEIYTYIYIYGDIYRPGREPACRLGYVHMDRLEAGPVEAVPLATDEKRTVECPLK